MSSIDILALSMSLLVLSPAIIIGLIMIASAVLLIISIAVSIVISICDMTCKVFKKIRKDR